MDSGNKNSRLHYDTRYAFSTVGRRSTPTISENSQNFQLVGRNSLFLNERLSRTKQSMTVKFWFEAWSKQCWSSRFLKSVANYVFTLSVRSTMFWVRNNWQGLGRKYVVSYHFLYGWHNFCAEFLLSWPNLNIKQECCKLIFLVPNKLIHRMICSFVGQDWESAFLLPGTVGILTCFGQTGFLER